MSPFRSHEGRRVRSPAATENFHAPPVPGPRSPVPDPESRLFGVPHHQHGFTLLEVMAAIVILALAFAVLLKAMGSSVALTHQAAARTEAAAWAQSMLDSAYAMEPPQPGVTAGRFDATYRWRLQVSPWQPHQPAARRQKPSDPDPRLQLYKLDLAVMWGTPPRQHVAHFATLRAVRRHADEGPAP